MSLRAKKLWSKLILSRIGRTCRKSSPDVNLPTEGNPLAALQHPCPPAPRWENMRKSVLLRAEAFAREEESSRSTNLVERAQFATAIALFIVIACCIIGLLVPSNARTGELLQAGFSNDGSTSGAAEPALAFYQHP